jgi:hypothetical protein
VLLQGFFASFYQCAGHLFQPTSAMFSRLRSRAHDWYFLCSVLPRRCSRASIGSRIADSSSSCYRVVQVDAHAPFDLARGPETCPWKRLCGFARWGSVPFAGDRGRGNYPSMGSPRLAALAGS